MTPSHPYVKHYTYRVHWSEEDDAYVAKVLEFPSLGADGQSRTEALDEMEKLLVMVLEDMEADGDPIPEPQTLKSYSGRFNVRIPPLLHAELATKAAEQGVSLNQYVTLKLAK